MMNRFFDAWVAFMLRHRFTVLILVGLVTAGFAFVASQLPLISALPDYIPKSALFTAWQETRDRFGGDEIALVAIESDKHFTKEGLQRLDRTVQKIEAHPFVDRAISITNAQQLETDPEDPESLLIHPFVRDDVSPDESRRALLKDSFARSLLSEDGKVVFIPVQLIPSRDDVASQDDVMLETKKRLPPGAERPGSKPGQLLDVSKQIFSLELIQWVHEEGYPVDKIHTVGFPVFIASIVNSAQTNLMTLLPMTVLLIGGALLLLLRRFSDALIPMLCIGPAVIWATAIGGLLLGRLTIMTSLVPIMVLVVGVSDVVHLVTQFRHELARGHEKNEAIRLSFRHVGAACSLTSLTTFIGFGSMMLLPIPQSRELGVFAAFGVVTAFVLSFILTPILLSFAKPVSQANAQADMDDILTRVLGRVASFVGARPKIIFVGGLALTAASLAIVTQTTVENSFTKKLGDTHPITQAVELIEKYNAGTGDLEIVVRSSRVDGVKTPDVITALSSLKKTIQDFPLYSSSLSLADLIEQIDRAIAPERDKQAGWTQAQIAQYLLLFEMSGGEDLEQLIDDTGQYTRMNVRVRDATAEGLNTVANAIEKEAKRIFPTNVEVSVNGIGVLASKLAPDLLGSSMRGFASALALIAVLLTFLFMSLRVGALSLIPNILPVALGVAAVSASIGYIDADTLAFIAVCIGIAVDDTIHFLARYRIEREAGKQREEAVRATIIEAGHGIVRTSIVLTFGFIAMIFSDYLPIVTVGILLPITLLAAVALDLSLVPAMAQLGLLEPKTRKNI